MRALLLDIGDELFDTNASSIPSLARSVLEEYSRLAVQHHDSGHVILVGRSDQASRFQRWAAGSIAKLGLRFSEVRDLNDLANLESSHQEISPGCGSAECSGLHGAVFLTRDTARADEAIARGWVPYNLARFDAPECGADLVQQIGENVRFEPCHKKRAFARGRIQSDAMPRAAKDSRIEPILAGVDETRLHDTLKTLVAFGSRWSYGSNIQQVTQKIYDLFIAAGYAQSVVQFQPFSIPQSANQRNILCGQPGPSKGCILLCAHYDSVASQPALQAPGCDDNASGIAVLLEVARVLRSQTLGLNVAYAAFGGEEQGLFGSQKCANIAATEGWKIELVINMDMVGFQANASSPQTVIEFDQGNTTPTNDAAAKKFGMEMAQLAKDFTPFSVQHTDIWNSDYMPFEAKGYPCVGLYDGAADEPFYHSAADTIDKVHLPSLKQIARLVAASVLTFAGIQ